MVLHAVKVLQNQRQRAGHSYVNRTITASALQSILVLVRLTKGRRALIFQGLPLRFLR